MNNKHNIIKSNLFACFFATPPYIILFVSSKCWMKCTHCWYNEEWKINNIGREEISLSDIFKIANSIKKCWFLSITGGEACLRGDLTDIFKIFSKNNKILRFQIPTSGYNTDLILEKVEKILEIIRGKPFRVDVSLDGSAEIHNEIRGVDKSFDNAVETIKSLNKIKKYHNNFDVGVITTISNKNEMFIDETFDIVSEINPNGEWMINIVRGNPRDENALKINIQQYLKTTCLINSKRETYNLSHSGHLSAKWLSAKNNLRRKVIAKVLMKNMNWGGCSAGSLIGVIYPDGSVYPCELFYKPMGNLNKYDYNLKDLWGNSHAKKIRKDIEEKKCLCTQECVWSTNILSQPRFWYQLVKERMKIK